MDYIISIIVSVIAAVLGAILKTVINENRELRKAREARLSDRDRAIEGGLVCILRKHLMDEHETWVAKGYITAHALENGLAMYKAYKTLGGNGMIDHMEDEIQELPIKD